MNAATWNVTEADILSRAEVQQVIDELDRKAPRSVNTRQTRAIFVLATYCGLRVSEACGLTLGNIKARIARPVIIIPKAIAKGKRGRTILLFKLPTALRYLDGWKAERERQGAKPGDFFVCGQARGAHGNRLDRRNARARFISACKVLGAERQAMLSIHNGRHTCASHLLAARWSLPEVMKLLGHRNIATTSIYSHVLVDDEAPVDPFAFVDAPGRGDLAEDGAPG